MGLVCSLSAQKLVGCSNQRHPLISSQTKLQTDLADFWTSFSDAKNRQSHAVALVLEHVNGDCFTCHCNIKLQP